MAGMNVMEFSSPHAEGEQPELKYTILFPTSMTRNSNNVEQSMITEDGHTKVIVSRMDKQSISMAFTCSSAWVKKFKQFRMMQYFLFKAYDPIAEGDQTREVRMTNYSESLIKNSHTVDSTVSQGLWNVSFTLEEL